MSTLTTFARYLTGSTMLVLACLVASANISCAEEEFSCCECTFPNCLDGMGASASQRYCVCPSTPYTYESCALFCRDQAPLDLKAAGFQMCGTATTTLAKNSCSIGSPVGAP